MNKSVEKDECGQDDARARGMYLAMAKAFECDLSEDDKMHLCSAKKDIDDFMNNLH